MNNKKDNSRISIFYSLLMLFLLSGVIVFYINNLIIVNNLINTNSEIKENINKTIQSNYQFQIEIEKETTFEKVRKIAEEKFNMKISDSSALNRSSLVIKKSDLN